MSGGANTVTLAKVPSTSSGCGASGYSDDHSDVPSINPVAVGHLGLLLTNLNFLQVPPVAVAHLWHCMKFA